jgi:hypothetical protein
MTSGLFASQKPNEVLNSIKSFSIFFLSTSLDKIFMFFQVIWAFHDCKVSLFLYLNMEM